MGRKRVGVFLLMAMLGVSSGLDASETGALRLTVTGIEKKVGKVRVGILRSEADYEASFKEGGQSRLYRRASIPAFRQDIEFLFERLPVGEYAVKVFQDKDGDKKVKMGMFGPKEPVGYSNNAWSFLGAPSFSKVVIFVRQGRVTTANIRLR